MALPTTQESMKLFELKLKESMSPIWPNLTKRQTSLEFITKAQFRTRNFEKAKPIELKQKRQEPPEGWTSPTGLIPYANTTSPSH